MIILNHYTGHSWTICSHIESDFFQTRRCFGIGHHKVRRRGVGVLVLAQHTAGPTGADHGLPQLFQEGVASKFVGNPNWLGFNAFFLISHQRLLQKGKAFLLK